MQVSEPTKNSGRPLRRDARRNRDAITKAAADSFARQGIDAPLDGIAKAAGVAIGTLYSHFPSRADLVEVVFAEKLDAWLAAAEQAAAADDPWEGFAGYLEAICELQADDRGLSDIASMQTSLADRIDTHLTQTRDLARVIVQRAQEQGSLRADVSPDDMVFVIWAHNRITAATRNVAPDAWRRHLALMLDAFRAERSHPLPVPPMTSDQVRRAMTRPGEGEAG
ncbi:TetR family transcriptional regulator [Streptomyces sp. AS58]|uniref:TetR/AcrR family transcriptional regulator n=1 Tax=Streptomyces cadmiisoli TaxID=2184053 RepID=A0A2Z4J961_9ACTN|nr:MULTISPECIES: TetR/AcrR family transcriptional regulator [Streptomyces]AWW41540.1 TetR/AcrR family transcriptional regulator [Streptomyces cadmiisoli]KOV74795.1 TetR family transcriptional regulator [Streptomyces sp. AS58]